MADKSRVVDVLIALRGQRGSGAGSIAANGSLPANSTTPANGA